MLATPQRTKVWHIAPFSPFLVGECYSSPEGIFRYTLGEYLMIIEKFRGLQHVFFWKEPIHLESSKVMHLFLKFLGRIIVNRFSVVDPYPHLSLDNKRGWGNIPDTYTPTIYVYMYHIKDLEQIEDDGMEEQAHLQAHDKNNSPV